MALIENIQREDLNAIEEGLAYRRLGEEFHLTQDAIATAVGKDRSTVANMVRLLKLPDEVQEEVAAGRLSMGHARALLALPTRRQQRTLARDIIARSLSVRETEGLVKKAIDAGPRAGAAAQVAEGAADVHTRAAEESCVCSSARACASCGAARRGRIEIEFVSEDGAESESTTRWPAADRSREPPHRGVT